MRCCGSLRLSLSRQSREPCRWLQSTLGPLPKSNSHLVIGRAAKSRPGRRQRFGGAVGAAHRLPCGARPCGPVAQLASFAALSALRHVQRVRGRCALARAGHKASAPRRPAGALPPARARLCGSSRGARFGNQPRWPSRRAVPGRGDLWGGEERRTGVGARSALRRLTRRTCLSAESAANEASCAARPQAEHRSAVGAERRPPHHEPLPGAACRDAQDSRLSRMFVNSRKWLQRDTQRAHVFDASWVAHKALGD